MAKGEVPSLALGLVVPQAEKSKGSTPIHVQPDFSSCLYPPNQTPL